MFLALMAALPLAGTARAADSAASLRKENAADHAAYTRLYTKKDVNGLRKLMARVTTPGFTYRDAQGHTWTVAQWLAQTRSDLAHTRKVNHAVLTQQNVMAKGNRGTVMAKGDFSMVMAGPQGKTHTMSGLSTFREDLVKTPVGWKMTRLVELTSKPMVDGKPASPAMMNAMMNPGGMKPKAAMGAMKARMGGGMRKAKAMTPMSHKH
jgi:hypothetical protein